MVWSGKGGKISAWRSCFPAAQLTGKGHAKDRKTGGKKKRKRNKLRSTIEHFPILTPEA
jgi:hypothetical protein